MNLKLITTHKDYLLLITDEEPKDGSENFWTYDALNNNILHIEYISYFGNANSGRGSVENGRAYFKTYEGTASGIKNKLIIAHLPLNNSPILEGVPLLPELPKQEDAVEQLANSHQEFLEQTAGYNKQESYKCALSFISGYKANTKRWSNEEMLNAIKVGMQSMGIDNDDEHVYSNTTPDLILQSLSTVKLPVDFQPEIEDVFKAGNVTEFNGGHTFKIINNILQGRWTYEK